MRTPNFCVYRCISLQTLSRWFNSQIFWLECSNKSSDVVSKAFLNSGEGIRSGYVIDQSMDKSIQIVHGRESILRMQPMLIELSARCGQAGAMNDLEYFMTRPSVLKKTPHLVLVMAEGAVSAENATADQVVGAALLYEYLVLGRGLRIYATDETTGRRSLVAPPSLRYKAAAMMSGALLDRGVHVALISFRDEATSAFPEVVHDKKIASRWAWREREVISYLPLESTFDATLAKIERRTRKNLRYYRRRAEMELGCIFLPEAEIGKAEFLALNRASMYAVPDRIAEWRYDSSKSLSGPVLMGIKDRDGRWLGIVGGRRHNGKMEIHWQMNRSDLPLSSLSTVLRSYLIEYEISRGTQSLYVEGGTKQALADSFTRERSTDLIVLQRSLTAFLLRKVARFVIPSENMLSQMLIEKGLVWHHSGERISPSSPQSTTAKTESASEAS
jgi:hypothetical protein